MIGHSIALEGRVEVHIIRHIMLMVALFSTLCLPIASAKVYINSGFEANPIEGEGWTYAGGWCNWDQPARTNPCQWNDRSTDIAFSGSASLKQVFDADWSDPNPQSHTQSIEQRPGVIASAGRDVWTKYRYRTVAFSYTAWTSTKQTYIKNTQTTAPTWISLFFNGSKELGFGSQGQASPCPLHPELGPFQSCNYYPNMARIPILDNQWYCIEEHVHFNNVGQSNGNVEIFVNGAQTLGYYGIKWVADTPSPSNATPAGTPCCFGWNLPTTVVDLIALYKQNGDGVRYFDDFVVADTRIGCSGTTPPADATPPSPPANFRVTQLLGLYASLMHQLGLAPLLGV